MEVTNKQNMEVSNKPKFMPAEEYHAMHGWSSTQVKRVINHSIERALQPIEDSNALEFGRTMHDYFESPQHFTETYAVFDDTDIIRSIREKRPDISVPTMTKDYKVAKKQFDAENEGKTVVTWADHQKLRQMYESAMSLPFITGTVNHLIADGAEAIQEGSFFDRYQSQQGGAVDIKARPDYFISAGEESLVIDWKSCRDASAHRFKSDFFTYGYDVQAVFYSMILGIDPARFYFVAVEKEAPFASAIYSLSEETIDRAQTKVINALERIALWEFTEDPVLAKLPSTREPVCL